MIIQSALKQNKYYSGTISSSPEEKAIQTYAGKFLKKG
jgi:hypothetical protein